ncbi:MAG: deoxyribodipyrimidine photo-lyase [Spirochaetales bacterium]|nr:deoxyribodipyrimidine photo-lyase [Spirochaetales bacterium]
MATVEFLPASLRARALNGRGAAPGDYVLYWMQASQRVLENPALEQAVERANELSLPVVVGFGLSASVLPANPRHYAFMLQGLEQVGPELERRGIRLAVLSEAPDQAALALGRRAALIITDAGYLRRHRSWRARVATEAPCAVVQVEGNAVVPVEEASDRGEWAAATFRPRIRRRLPEYLAPTQSHELRRDSLGLELDLPLLPPRSVGPGLLTDSALRPSLELDPAPGPVSPWFPGGTAEALRRLEGFVSGPLREYHSRRNDPGLELHSGLSPYLHFGQISPITVALAVQQAPGVPEEARAAFLEELIVRRELSFNYVHHEARYDRYEALPEWARRTLDAHRRDPRPYLYSPQELEAAASHDPYWNAAMREMRTTGSMHGYMRMYWGKKILEWSPSPEEGFAALVELNDRYFLDGRDPNSYAGTAWCFGRHDRPWPERPVFGKVRSMTASGLRRKFDMEAYLRRIDSLPGQG